MFNLSEIYFAWEQIALESFVEKRNVPNTSEIWLEIFWKP